MKLNKKLDNMRLRIEGHKTSHEEALADDDPKGTCAAHHRGAIDADRFTLELLKELIESSNLEIKRRREK